MVKEGEYIFLGLPTISNDNNQKQPYNNNSKTKKFNILKEYDKIKS